MSPKNPAAVSLGRKGGYARAKKMTAEERSNAARKAVEARWAKTDKNLAKLESVAKRITEESKLLERAATKKAKRTKPK